jgi:hypothetical protein
MEDWTLLVGRNWMDWIGSLVHAPCGSHGRSEIYICKSSSLRSFVYLWFVVMPCLPIYILPFVGLIMNAAKARLKPREARNWVNGGMDYSTHALYGSRDRLEIYIVHSLRWSAFSAFLERDCINAICQIAAYRRGTTFGVHISAVRWKIPESVSNGDFRDGCVLFCCLLFGDGYVGVELVIFCRHSLFKKVRQIMRKIMDQQRTQISVASTRGTEH